MLIGGYVSLRRRSRFEPCYENPVMFLEVTFLCQSYDPFRLKIGVCLLSNEMQFTRKIAHYAKKIEPKISLQPSFHYKFTQNSRSTLELVN